MSLSAESQSLGGEDQIRKMESGQRQMRQAADRESIPEGAVVMQRQEIGAVMQKLIENWQPAKDVRSLKYGSLLLGAMAGFNGALFSTHFRRRMVLGHRARLASYLPSIVIPAITTTMMHDYLQFERLLGMQSPCLFCSEVNAACTQLLGGVLQPYILSVLAAAAVAKVTMLYPLPPVRDVAACIRTVRLLSQRLSAFTYIAIAGSVLNSLAVSHYMGKSVARVHEKLHEKKIYMN